MHRTAFAWALALLLIAPALLASEEEGEPSLEELKAANKDLELRIENLEAGNLSKDVDNYLETHQASAADSNLLPGGKAIRFSGQIRLRPEFRKNWYLPINPTSGLPTDPNNSWDVALSRVRLRADVDVTNNVRAVIEIQDVRFWGEELSTVGNLDNLDLKLGYMEFREIGGSALGVEAGRWVMWYGDQRLIGHLEWANQGRTYDGIRALYHPEGWWTDGFAVRVSDLPFLDNDRYLAGFYGGYGEKLQAYAIYTHDNSPFTGEGALGNQRFWTLGARWHDEPGQWDYTLELPVQVGEFNGDDHFAWAFATTVGFTFEDAAWTPRVYVEFNFASGDENSTDGESDQFKTLYPTAHLYHGYADLVGWENILNLRVGVVAKPADKWRLRFDYHHFQRDTDQGVWVNAGGLVVRPGAAGTSKNLGDEFDIVVYWTPFQQFGMQFGYGVFLPGSFVSDTGDDPVSHFGWIQALLKF